MADSFRLPWSLDDPYTTIVKTSRSLVCFNEHEDPRYFAKYASVDALRNELRFYSSPNYAFLDKASVTKEYGQKKSGIPKFYGVLTEPLPKGKYFGEPTEGFLVSRCEGLSMRDFVSIAPAVTPSKSKGEGALSLNETTVFLLLNIVARLHECRVVHGDLAFRNVIVNFLTERRASVSLVDFGSSRVFDVDGQDDEVFKEVAKGDVKNFGRIVLHMHREDLLADRYEALGRGLCEGSKSLEVVCKAMMRKGS